MVVSLSPSQSPEIEKKQNLERLRHTSAHILAMAVQKLYPETKVTIGPVTDSGFYYDFDRKQPFTPDELKKIKAEMRRIIQANLPIIREEIDRKTIHQEIEKLGKIYKIEILENIPDDETLTRYFIGTPDAGRWKHKSS